MFKPTTAEIKGFIEQSQKRLLHWSIRDCLQTYWRIGEIIVRHEQKNQIRATYAEKSLKHLSKELTKELG